MKSRAPRGSTLKQHFESIYNGYGSPEFRIAQRNFVESLAGYSILTYLLQIKDRHNGNILLREGGRLIHIDFNFMLSTSPGGINFESSPFKLTKEYLELMDSDADGVASEAFNYYKVLCIQGYLACRKTRRTYLAPRRNDGALGMSVLQRRPKSSSKLTKTIQPRKNGRSSRGNHVSNDFRFHGCVEYSPIRFLPARFERHLMSV